MTGILLADALALYREQYLVARNLAPLTRFNYLLDLTDLIGWLGEEAHRERAAHVDRRDLENYLVHLDHRGLKGSSRRRKVAAIRSFFTFLYQQELIPFPLAERLIPPAREPDHPRVLSGAEYQRLIDAAKRDRRDAAVIELLLQTGLRLSEVAQLRLTSLELPAQLAQPDPSRRVLGSWGTVKVAGKGRKRRTIPLNWKVCQALRVYLTVRPAVEDDHLFITKFGRGIGPRSIENLVAKYLQEVAITGASVHSLRHTFATYQVKHGTPLHVLQEVLGHESLETTLIYVGLARAQQDLLENERLPPLPTAPGLTQSELERTLQLHVL